MDASVTHKAPATRRDRISARKSAKWLLIAAVLLVAAVFGYRYWRHSQLYASTDNAYVNANLVEVAAQVSGAVTRIFVRDNQPVKAGDPLFDIDPEPYRVALEKAQAQLKLAEQSVAQQSAAVQAAEAQVAQRRAELQNARSNNAREQQLVRQGFISRQGSEAARTQEATALAASHAAEASLEQARSALGATGERNANIQAARAAVAQAEIDLQRTRVSSSTQGYVANLSLRPGNTVQPGVPLFSIIGSQEYWVDANFKETELESVRPGEPATITVDMYPDHPFHGVVESVSGGAGTAFSLLPPQNATGNWVKVTQRVPVRVRVTDPDPRYPLRVGTTATVELAIRETAPTSGR
jgi:membrane fusion protein (multidrug efflux system)